MRTMTEIEYKHHVSECDGICAECGEITYGGVEPDAEGYECEHCGCNEVMGIENALITGILGIEPDLKGDKDGHLKTKGG